MEEKLSRIEAVLFTYGEPLEIKKLSKATEIPLKEVPILVDSLNSRYNDSNSALKVERLGDYYQIVTKKDFSKYVQNVLEVNHSNTLSSSMMEVLTIVAYNQPVTRIFIESVRGIDSTNLINKLVEKDLISESERLNIPGRPITYRTTPNFLRCFSLNDISELPPLPYDRERQSNETEDIPNI
ncbi:MAG: SMC-Scp complex subunit ScpB [Oscillospiraceae bacterium]